MSSKSHLTIALLSLLAAACAAPTGEANGGNDLRVTEADNGKTVSAAVGQGVLVSVTDYGDSGYTWSVVNAGGLGGGSQSHVGGSSQAGDFGTDVFTFTTSGLPAGEYTIELVDEQTWDPTTAIPFSVTVKIGQ